MRRSFGFRRASLVACAAGGTTGCSPKRDEKPPTTKEAIAEAGALAASTPAPSAAPVPACAALDPAKIAPLATCTATVVKTPVPEIVDEHHSLSPFFDRLAALERGSAARPLRIAIYGDSNLTSDFLPGHLRRVLQTRYGDAGHGWVSLSRPWGSYRHEDVSNAGFWPMFKLYAPTTHLAHDKQYGFANMAAESSEIGASAWAGTTKDPKAKVGQKVSRFELHYLKQPRGGSFTVQIDRKDVRSIETRAPAFEAGIETFEVDDGPHELRCVVRGDGKVRLFGASLDRSPAMSDDAPGKPGIQIDSLGAGALNYERLTWVANDTRRTQLARRAYDLVVIWLGMNVMFVPPNRDYAKTFITELQAALPAVPILVLGPSDTVKEGQTKSAPRIVTVARQMREVAAEAGVAFWDFREAMGGDGSIIGFTKRGLTGKDHIHFGPEGSRLMGDRLLCALSSSFAAHATEHPQAGCRAADADAGAPPR